MNKTKYSEAMKKAVEHCLERGARRGSLCTLFAKGFREGWRARGRTEKADVNIDGSEVKRSDLEA